MWRSRQRTCFGSMRSSVRSGPPRPVHRDVAQPGSAPVWGTGGRRFKSCHSDQRRALRGGRSSMAEPWAVNPLVSVRFRSVTPQRIEARLAKPADAARSKRAARKAWGFKSLAGHQIRSLPSWRKWQTQRSQKPWPTGMPVRPGPRGPSSTRRRAARAVRGRLAKSKPVRRAPHRFESCALRHSFLCPVRLEAEDATLSPSKHGFDSRTGRHPCGCSSRVEQPALNRQVRVRSPASAPDRSIHRWGVVERPQTAGFEPVHAGSNPATPANPWLPSSEAEQRSYKATVGISEFPGATKSMPAWRNRQTRGVESAVPQGVQVRSLRRALQCSPSFGGEDGRPHSGGGPNHP